MKTVCIALILSLLAVGAAHAQEGDDWHHVANAIPLGSRVKIQTLDGKRMSGTLMRVDGESVSIKRNARMPEAAVTVAFDRISNLERDHGGGVSLIKAIAAGAGVGAGVILTLIVFAMQLD
jgi:hypothetical protein